MATQSACTIHNCPKPLYMSVDVDDGEPCIRAADNTMVLFSECLISEQEMDYITTAINFYERAGRLLDGTKG